ncbi:hypothetical protein HWB99_gp068 [Mycobacterium phage DrLupo]|uniref:Uncharacterized protein n=1 Tax=Mycobacterium phage DrLupo TaxID=2499037 RepID=A0A3S9UQP2_9CAUD|nr:hypothetical protein HWB99_gp068 [Mycobacterium phage DrLupo]AZS12604.1 hypothetical protein SEA_DRLUPO_68 [Mycobacterium phage DrLupo]
MKAVNRGVAHTQANLVGIPHGRDRRDPRLPPPSNESDDYTIALHGSEGNSLTPVKLSRSQLETILKLEDRINAAAKLSGYYPKFVVYHGGLRNVGTKEDPVWEPAGRPVRNQRI